MKTAIQIAASILIGLLSGVGFVHLTIAGDIKEHGVRIQRIEKDIDNERSRTDQRIFEVAGLVKEVISSNRDMLAVIRTQNELLKERGSK